MLFQQLSPNPVDVVVNLVVFLAELVEDVLIAIEAYGEVLSIISIHMTHNFARTSAALPAPLAI